MMDQYHYRKQHDRGYVTKSRVHIQNNPRVHSKFWHPSNSKSITYFNNKILSPWLSRLYLDGKIQSPSKQQSRITSVANPYSTSMVKYRANLLGISRILIKGTILLRYIHHINQFVQTSKNLNIDLDLTLFTRTWYLYVY